MSELKNLIPPLELCKKIPAGNFTTTALAYYGDVFYKNISVLPRESGDCIQKDICIAPAPTLPEILIALEDMGYYCPTAFHQANTWQVNCMTETDESPSSEYLDATDLDNAAAAALKLYLELIGFEDETKTCRECRYFKPNEFAAICKKKRWGCDDKSPACNRFKPKVITNGDRIRQGGDDAVIAFAQSFNYSFPIPIENLTKGKYTDEECWEIYLQAKKKKYSQIEFPFSKPWAGLKPDYLPIDVQVSYVTELRDGFQSWLRFEVIKNDKNIVCM